MAKCSISSLESLVIEMQQIKIGHAFFQASLVLVLKNIIRNDIQGVLFRNKSNASLGNSVSQRQVSKGDVQNSLDELLSGNYSFLHL